MVRLEVKDGKVMTQMRHENNGFPIYEEVGNGIIELLVRFHEGVINAGNSKEAADASYREMLSVIIFESNKRVLGGSTVECNQNNFTM